MLTESKKEQLIFFGILLTFLVVLTYLVHFFSPFKFHLIWVVVLPLMISILVTILKFGFNDEMQTKNQKIMLMFFFIFFALGRWTDYFKGKKADWNLALAVLYTFLLVLMLFRFFKRKPH